MSQDKYELLGSLYADIGGEIADIVGGDPNGAFLHAEVGEGWVFASVFKDEGSDVRYFDPSSELSDLLLEPGKPKIPTSGGPQWNMKSRIPHSMRASCFPKRSIRKCMRRNGVRSSSNGDTETSR